MKNIVINTLSSNELFQLTELFVYHDVDEMIKNNSEQIESGVIDIFVLYIDEKLVGELRVMYSNSDERFAKKGVRAYLYAFRIHIDFRGKGLGKYLLKNVIDVLSMKGYDEFTVGVEDDNHRAIHIYKDFGFNEIIARIHEEYQGEGYDYNLYLNKQKVT